MFERLKQFNKEEKTPSFKEISKKAIEEAQKEKEARQRLEKAGHEEIQRLERLSRSPIHDITEKDARETEQWVEKHPKDSGKEQKAA